MSNVRDDVESMQLLEMTASISKRSASSANTNSKASLYTSNASPTITIALRRSTLIAIVGAITAAFIIVVMMAKNSEHELCVRNSPRVHHAAIPSPYSCLGYSFDVKRILFDSPLYTSQSQWPPQSSSSSSPPPSGNRVLVTGAAGFIGSHVAEFIIKEMRIPYVICVDDMSGGYWANVPSGCIFVQGDLKDPEFVDHLFTHYGPFDAVYHLAAYAAEGLSHFIRHFNYRNNLISTMSLINSAILTKVPVFVFTSSIAAYGAAPTPMKEYEQAIPEDPYGISKFSIELDLKAALHMFGLEYVVFRPHNVYGPNQNIYDRYRNVIGIFMAQLLRGEPMTIFGDGTQTRAFSYIDDVAPYIAISPFIPSARNQIFNIGGDTPYSLNTLAKTVSASFGKDLNVRFLDARKEVQDAVADHSKLRCVFGIDSAVDLETGIEKMAAWVRKTGKSLPPAEFKRVEVLENLPPSWITADINENSAKKLSTYRIRSQTDDKEVVQLNQRLSQQLRNSCYLCPADVKNNLSICPKNPSNECFDQYISANNMFDGINPKTNMEEDSKMMQCSVDEFNKLSDVRNKSPFGLKHE